ncbi:hypothetical protein ROZALSC1DRAFT_23601 [Rozella allomycis CSF55]|uniref:Uncharacterized protein n=1 Tax=Rozella allomycis (strain CSF55) TaxID=988480 RepID=A0A4P9YGB8_ROZAC|nr:hypothetical protein ROZALSC1DRAFT_23601 [Rozella allomycis CSF55]
MTVVKDLYNLECIRSIIICPERVIIQHISASNQQSKVGQKIPKAYHFARSNCRHDLQELSVTPNDIRIELHCLGDVSSWHYMHRRNNFNKSCSHSTGRNHGTYQLTQTSKDLIQTSNQTSGIRQFILNSK